MTCTYCPGDGIIRSVTVDGDAIAECHHCDVYRLKRKANLRAYLGGEFAGAGYVESPLYDPSRDLTSTNLVIQGSPSLVQQHLPMGLYAQWHRFGGARTWRLTTDLDLKERSYRGNVVVFGGDAPETITDYAEVDLLIIRIGVLTRDIGETKEILLETLRRRSSGESACRRPTWIVESPLAPREKCPSWSPDLEREIEELKYTTVGLAGAVRCPPASYTGAPAVRTRKAAHQ